MKAKVIRSDISFLEDKVNEWLDKAGRISIQHMLNLSQNAHSTNMYLLIFYNPAVTVKKNPGVEKGEIPKCAKCGKPMRVVNNKINGDLFWGCMGFPECKSSIPFSEEDWERYGSEVEPKEQEDIPF